MNAERRGWKNLIPEDATDAELNLVHKIFGPKPEWMDDRNWRINMRECARDIREHVSLMANTKVTCSSPESEAANKEKL